MSRAISYEMKKAPKKPRAPKPKAPKASKIKQKQKQSVNVKIHIDNSRPARRAPAASRAHASPFPQPVSSYPIFRDVPPSPSVHYNPAPVAQPTVVAQGFHGIPPATARVRRTPPRSVSSGYASDMSDISNSSTLRSMSNLSSVPQSVIRLPVARRTPQRGIVIGSGNTSDASNSTISAMSGLGSMNNSLASVVSLKTPSVRERVRQIQENVRAEDAAILAGTYTPIFAGYGPTVAERRAERLRRGEPILGVEQLRTRIAPTTASPSPLLYEAIYPPQNTSFYTSRPGHSDKDSKDSKHSKR